MRRLIIQMPGAGGVTKTTVCELAHATITSRGERVVLVDGDIVNKSLTQRLGSGIVALTLRDWLHLEGVVERILDLADAQDSTVILDMGASAVALAPMDEFLANLVDAMMARGGHVWLSLATLPNKPGAAAEIRRLLKAGLAPGMRSLLVQSDVDGSGNFDEVSDLVVDAQVRIPHIMPGFMALRRQRPSPFFDNILDPPVGYRKAAGMLAYLLLSVLTQPGWVAAFGAVSESTLMQLREMSSARPQRWYTGRRNLTQVSDAALAADEARIVAQERFERLPADVSAGQLVIVARQYLQAVSVQQQMRM